MNEVKNIKNMSFEDFETISKKTFKTKLKDIFFKMPKFPSIKFRLFKISSINFQIPKFPSLNWKAPLKKTGRFANAIILTLVFIISVAYFSLTAFGFRTSAFVEKISYKNYEHTDPSFSFKYPDYYEIDYNKNKNFGKNHIIGFRLKTDSRVGCDIYQSKKGINFKRTDEEINDALVRESLKSSKSFHLKKYERIKIDGNNAISQEFTFIDSSENETRATKVISGHDKDFYIFICGTGEYQYKFFQKDFEGFLKSFQWR